ncbi:MAG TPA: FkbM family methyltransferase [Chthoniobacterales bacterium]|nr:FkbM family methyltransferase [Chthoniobacterales bacterium]
MEVTAHPGRHGVLCHYPGDELIGESLAYYGEWAEEELYLLSSLIRAADTVVDVGANIGTHTIALSRFVGPTGRVLSIEGQSRAFALLTLNTFLNAADNVHCVPAIVGKESGLRMVAEEDAEALRNLACFSFAPPEMPAPADRPDQHLLFPVPMVALDDLQLPRCELLKIDAEGMELDVMLGAVRTIERFRPVIYFEQARERHFPQTLEFLRDISYGAFWHVADPYNRNNLKSCSHNIFGGTREVMVLALPREKPNGLEQSGFVLDEISQPIYNPPREPAPDPGWALPQTAYGNLPSVDFKRIENLLEEIRLARAPQ